MTAPAAYTPTEMMTIVAARALSSKDVCFVGIGAPSAACNLARLTHAPGITLIYESGTIATKPNVLPLSSWRSKLAIVLFHRRAILLRHRCACAECWALVSAQCELAIQRELE